jgi:hypothetical protein
MSVTFFPLTVMYPCLISSSASRLAHTPLLAIYLLSLTDSGSALEVDMLFLKVLRGPAEGPGVTFPFLNSLRGPAGAPGFTLSFLNSLRGPAAAPGVTLSFLNSLRGPAAAPGVTLSFLNSLRGPAGAPGFTLSLLKSLRGPADLFSIVYFFQGANLQLFTGFSPIFFAPLHFTKTDISWH